MDTLKIFFKIWSYFIGFAVGIAFVVWVTILAADYSFALGLFVCTVGFGGLVSAVFAIGFRQ